MRAKGPDVRSDLRPAAEPLHVRIPNALAAEIRAEATRRGVAAHALISAVMSTVLADGMVDAILDGDAAGEIAHAAGGQGRNADGLTLLQSGVLYLLVLHSGRDGWCRRGVGGLQSMMEGASFSGVQSALASLARDGLVRRGAREPGCSVVPWQATDAGMRTALDFGALGGKGEA